MLPETKARILLGFAVFMVMLYLGFGIILFFTDFFNFENKGIVGIALMVYGIFRAARAWSNFRNSDFF